MQTANIKDFVKGWFYGAFTPTLCHNENTEIGLHHYKKGFVSQPHIHLIATEINIIVRGQVSIGQYKDIIYLEDGDIFIFKPNEYKRVVFLENTDLVVVKTPSLPLDKYPCSQ